MNKGFRADAKAAGKVHMVGIVSVHNGGNNDNLIRYEFSGSLAYLPAKTDVSINRQMMAVVFDGGYWY